jgi:D-hydroxyproline dehydrogenase
VKTISTDISVIGAGIIGTCIAERLQREGKKVLLIDKQPPGEGCSKGNAGHFASDVILPLANFSTLFKVPLLLCDPLGPLAIQWSYFNRLFPWLVRFAWSAMPHKSEQTIQALKQLNRPAIQEFKQLLATHKLSYLMQQNGALSVFRSSKGKQQSQKHLTKVSAHGVNVSLISAHQLSDLEPEIKAHQPLQHKQSSNSNSNWGALYYPDSAHCIDPFKLVTSLVDCFLKQQGQLIQAKIEQITPHEDGVLLQANGLSIQSKKVIVAADAWSKPLANQLGFSVPLETERGYHLMLPTPSVKLTRPVLSVEDSFVMTPMQAGLRLAGTVEFAGMAAPPNYQRADMLLQHAKKLLPNITSGNATRWMGFRPSLPDSLPVLDSTYNNRILWAFGHQHLGLTQAAVSAQIITDLCLGKTKQDLHRDFSITRF